MRWWYRVGLILLLLSMSPLSVCAQGDRSTHHAGLAQRASLDGVLAMTHLDDQTAVTTLEQAVQCAPTNAVYAQALALARRTLGEAHP
jgi:hypothetical protein